MGLIDYMPQNPVGLAIPSSKYDDEFVVASLNTFINNLEVIDNIILNELANQNMANVSTDQKARGNQKNYKKYFKT